MCTIGQLTVESRAVARRRHDLWTYSMSPLALRRFSGVKPVELPSSPCLDWRLTRPCWASTSYDANGPNSKLSIERFLRGRRSMLSLPFAGQRICIFGQRDSTSRNIVEIYQGCEHDGAQMYSVSRRPVFPVFSIEFDMCDYCIPGHCQDDQEAGVWEVYLSKVQSTKTWSGYT